MLKLNERTGEFEEVKEKKGCGTFFIILFIVILVYALFSA